MSAAFVFDRFELRPANRQLRVDGRPVAIGARALDVLLALIERRDRLVAKSELLDLVWPDVIVEENNLQVQISALRKVLGPETIATIPGRGYQFVAALDGDDDAGAGAGGEPRTAATGRASAEPPARDHLTPAMSRLYGRDADVDTLCALISAHRLVTVVGAGGIGKSRLAQAAAQALAERWPDGVRMVELAGLSDPSLLFNAVAQSLDISMPGRGPPRDELIAGLAQRAMLLVLDNCEHLLDASASLAQAVLDGAPGVALLVTSQEPLRLAVEQQYRVTPLAVPGDVGLDEARGYGAVALLEARVRAANPRFALNRENVALAIDICRRLDGLPLAIELAAARVATLGLRPVRDKLEARFSLLTGGSRATLRRHQTLRAALEWSYNLLTSPERAVFARLGVFAGGFTMEMAQAVAGDDALDEWAVLDHLSALVDKSLVVIDAGDSPRYRLLESARAFALEQLAGGNAVDTLRRHALALRAFLERVDDANLDGELRTHQYAALVLPEQDNLRAAYAWASGSDGDREVAVALAAHAGALIDYAPACRDWLLAQRDAVEAGLAPPALAARYWRALAAGNMSGHVPRALQIDSAFRARALYQSLGRPRREFSSLIQAARHRIAQNDHVAAQAIADDARSLLRPDWPPEYRIMLLRIDGYIARFTRRHDDALELYRESVRASMAVGDWRLQVIARSNFADLLWSIGPIDDALRDVTCLIDELHGRPATAIDTVSVFANALGIFSEGGNMDEATRLAPEALATMRRAGEYYLEQWVYFFWRRCQVDRATRLLGACDARLARLGEPSQPNEARLLVHAREGLAAAQTPEAFAGNLAAGAKQGVLETHALIAEGLA